MNKSSMIVLDPSSGAAGDMILGALIDTGGDRSLLREIEDIVPVEFKFSRVERSNINAVRVEVIGGGDGGAGHIHRSLGEVIEIVRDSCLPEQVVESSVEVFRLIGEAESSVHNESLDELDFHEVGADDAIADVLGASMLIHSLDEKLYCLPISIGGGRVKTSHGEMPVPVPAVAEIMNGSRHRTRGGPVDEELLTPTGAALIRYFTEPVSQLPSIKIIETGYGAGEKDFPGHPNVLRAIRGDGEIDSEGIVVLETNLDDVSGEVIGGLYEKLMEEGARDVAVTPLMMKKNRPGYLVQVISKESDAEKLARLIAKEKGTLGVRSTRYTHRFIADREKKDIDIEIAGKEYTASVKIAKMSGEIYDVSAEYSDAERIAREQGLAVRSVLSEIEKQFSEAN